MAKELSYEEKKTIEKYINEQSEKAVELFDIENKKIKYNDKIKSTRNITEITGDEEIARAFLIQKLANQLGYPMDSIVLENTYTAGRPHTNTSRIDVIVRDKNENAYLFIEVKSPSEYATIDKNETIKEQLFKVAGMEKAEGGNTKYLVLYTVEVIDNKISDDCIIIDNEENSTYSDWEKNRNSFSDIPKFYGKATKTPYIKGSDKDLEKSFTVEMLKYLQNDLHNVLWGGGGTDDNDIFSSLTNLILAKIQDEDEKRNGDEYDFQTKSFESNDKLFERIDKLYKRALEQKLNITDQNRIEKSYVVDTNKFSEEKVKYTVQQLEKYSFVDGKNSLSGKDILGDFFEGIIRDGFKQTKGQFFTPVNIVVFMLWALKTDKLALSRINNDREIPYMIDPSAGSGTFLIEYMKFITKNIKYRFRDQLDTSRAVEDKVTEWFYPDNRENKWAREYIYGSELNFNLGTSTKVNMILHGDGSTNIFVGTQKGDGLLPFNEYVKPSAPNALNKEFDDDNYPKKINGQFDIILTNPPFSASLDNDTKDKVSKSFIYGNKKSTENLFIERYYQLLKEKGRLAVILPESVYDTSENKYIRLFIYKYFNVKAVVSLPQLTFEPYTSTKTSILIAQKKTTEEVKNWIETWTEKSKEYSNLRTRVENIIAVAKGKKKQENLPSIKDMSIEEQRNTIIEFINSYSDEFDNKLAIEELIEKYGDEISENCKTEKDEDELLNQINSTWVFKKVANKLDYKIMMAEVDNIGYKRTKKGEKAQKNELFRTDSEGKVLVDDGVEETILDYIRKINWEE